MSDAVASHTPDEIAAAVQGYVRALRLLGHRHTSLDAIAYYLGLNREQVSLAFDAFNIRGATTNKQIQLSFTKPVTTYSLQVSLKPMRTST